MKNLILLLMLASFSSMANLVPDTPVIAVAKTIDSYKITYFEVNVSDQLVTVIYDSLSGSEVISSEAISLQGADFLQVVGSMPDASKNMYENISQLLYDKLMSKKGIVGSVQ